jgi:hypothetical protein
MWIGRGLGDLRGVVRLHIQALEPNSEAFGEIEDKETAS